MKILVCCHEKKSRRNHTKSVFLSNDLFIFTKSLMFLAEFSMAKYAPKNEEMKINLA